jgi:flagellar biosynthetic protein FlhB
VAEESDLERTEPPSSRRLEKAREDGQVPQSRELMAFLVMAAAVGGFWSLGGWLTHHATGIIRRGLSFGRDTAFSSTALTESFGTLTWDGLLLASPVLLLTVAGAMATPLVLHGWLFSPKALAPRFERLDPFKGVKRMFSLNSISELVKAIMKALLIGGVIYWVVTRQRDQLFALIVQPFDTALPAFGQMLIYASVALVAGLAVIAAIDVPFQLWRYYRGLRMTKEEIRQENKEMEGDPQLKARIRSQQREVARRRMMAQVPKADVVVTNPTHFAVALKYDRDTMSAPQVVAKGINLVAQRIRDLATEHRVPVVEAPPLARALHRHAEVGDQVPAALYTAVAEVLAYVYQLGQYMGSDRQAQPPSPPAAIAVPDGLDPGASVAT